jgi:hypothetical protein
MNSHFNSNLGLPVVHGYLNNCRLFCHLGTTVGGLTTFATTLLNQRDAVRRNILAKAVANREQLYSEFLKEVDNLYFDSINRTIDDVSQQASLIKMYSLVGPHPNDQL